MGIDKDIRQEKFLNEHQRASVNILFTYGWMMERIKEVLKPAGITPQQFNILRILRGSHPKPLSTLQIRERMLDKMSDTSRIVDRLVVKSWANKATSREDRRLVDILISPKGLKLLEKLDTRQQELDAILQNISVKDAGILSKILDKIRNGG